MDGAVVDESLVATAAWADRQVAIWTTFANGVCLKALDEDQHRVRTESSVLMLVEKDYVAAGTNVDVHLLTIGVLTSSGSIWEKQLGQGRWSGSP